MRFKCPVVGWEIEMNVTERTELVPYIKRPTAKKRESELGGGGANGWRVGKCHRR